MSSDMTAWLAIGGAGFFLLLFVGLLLRHSVRPLLLWPALILLGAVLLTPAPHPSAEGVWVPAFVIALFEGLLQSSGNPSVALRLLLASCVTALAVSGGICGLLALRSRVSSRKEAHRSARQDTDLTTQAEG